jgi:IstB-like ATP binding protein
MSIDVTSNGFGDWNQVFAHFVVASAIVDRLLHNATVINIKGHSYRAASKPREGVLWSRDPELCTFRAQLCALFAIIHMRPAAHRWRPAPP